MFSAGLGNNDTPTDEQITQLLDNGVALFEVIDGSARFTPPAGSTT